MISGTNLNTLAANVTYDFTDRISGRISALYLDTPSISSTIYGLGGEYRFAQGGYANASFVDSDGSGDPIYSVGIGWRF